MPAIEARIAVLLVIRIAPNPVWDAEGLRKTPHLLDITRRGSALPNGLLLLNRFEETMVSGLAASGIS
jgi:hypothetical protein